MTGNNQRDPLADLFSNVQLTGLSKPKPSTNQLAPLQIDLPDGISDRNPPKTETGLKKPKRPPRFTGEEYESRASDIEIEEVDSEDETELNTSTEDTSAESQDTVQLEAPATEETSQVESEKTEAVASNTSTDVQAKLRLVMLQQKMQRQRMALKKKQEAEQAAVSVKSDTKSDTKLTSGTIPAAPVQSVNVTDSLAKLNSKLTQKDAAPSAMELFLAAAAESENPSPKVKEVVQPRTVVAPPVQSTKPVDKSVQQVSKETTITPKPLMGNRLMLQIEDMIRNKLPLLKEFHVASALDSFDRPLMKAIWRSHRSKFLMHGQLEYAVSALSVIDGLEHIEEGQLVAAYVETMASDYLIWVDIPNQRLVAAFADAKSYFANQ